MPDDGIRVELHHARRAHHHGRCARYARLTAVADTRPGAVRRSAGNDWNTALDFVEHDIEHAGAFAIVEARDLAVTPSAVSPFTPASTKRLTTRLRLASSRSPFWLNGVGSTE